MDQALQGIQCDLNGSAVLLQGGIPCLAQLQRLGHLVPPVEGLTVNVLQQQPSPGGLPHVGDAGEGKGLLLLPKPAVGVRVALDPSPDVQHDLDQPAVVPAGGHGVHQQSEVVPLPEGLIPPLQHRIDGLSHKDQGLLLIADPEVVVQIQPVALLPEEGGTEGINGGDLGLVKKGGLPPQDGISRPGGDPIGQLSPDALPQLGGGGLGVGDDQEAVQVLPLLHTAQQPLHQHPGLTRAGGGGHQKPAPPLGDGLLLLTCQLKGHSAASSLLCAVLYLSTTPASGSQHSLWC